MLITHVTFNIERCLLLSYFKNGSLFEHIYLSLKDNLERTETSHRFGEGSNLFKNNILIVCLGICVCMCVCVCVCVKERDH